ncbi:calcium/proton exchanger [Acidothermaceae bacterium B102]|nr:calcium/proton exchanger [Acidothermaceae bacterium B102]
MFAIGTLLCLASAITHYVNLGQVTAFVVAGAAIAVLALLVGLAVDQIAERLGAGATGVLQSALGNLPELFIGIFALRQGLVTVVQAAIVGSILANLLLVLGLAFAAGGLRHGTQTFSARRASMITTSMVLAVGALVVPSLASFVHTPASHHERALSVVTSVVLLVVFAMSVPASIRRSEGETGPSDSAAEGESEARWPVVVAVLVLAVTGVLAALVSDWFVAALTPAMAAVHISNTFAGLVIVAIAGNAVENVVGIQLALRNQADHALSVILNSPLQIALVLAPVLVLISPLIGGAAFTLVFPPLLIVALVIATIIIAVVILDGESNWLEGASLVGLYAVIATSFWWG